MAELRVANINSDLMAKVKAGAALSSCTIKEFVERLLTEALRRRVGRQRP
jgi:hypothetical protein